MIAAPVVPFGMSAAEDLYRQALALPEDERRALAERIAASVTGADDGVELDPEDVAAASLELDDHLADPSTSIDEATFRAHVAGRWGVR